MPKGKLTDYAAELGQAICAQIIHSRMNFTHGKGSQWEGQPGHIIDKETGCVLWNGRTIKHGYAQIKLKTPAQKAAGITGKDSGNNFLKSISYFTLLIMVREKFSNAPISLCCPLWS